MSFDVEKDKPRFPVADDEFIFFTKRQIDRDGPGIQLDEPQQPAVRVSWDEAMAFCRRLSQATGRLVTLPTEAQWEYAARAGATTSAITSAA